MIRIIRHVLRMAGIGLVFFLSANSVQMQEASKSVATTGVDKNCIKTELIGESGSNLEEKTPIPLVVRVYNNCEEDVELKSPPTFWLHRIKGKEEGGKRRRADGFVGQIIRKNETSLDKKRFDIKEGQETIKKDKYIEYVLDTNDIRWQDLISSIDVLYSLSESLEKEGGYYFYAEAGISFQNSNKTKRFLSNKIKFVFNK